MDREPYTSEDGQDAALHDAVQAATAVKVLAFSIGDRSDMYIDNDRGYIGDGERCGVDYVGRTQ